MKPKKKSKLPIQRSLGALLFLIMSLPSRGLEMAAAPARPRDLTDLSIEELMSIKVISASKKPQTVSSIPSAVHVITSEDIRRSGVTSLPEALRMAPGVQVARLDSHTWAISARGFNDVFANKLLVMIDGRSVYTPLFSGVYWDQQDTLLEDVERIEVIRGPGATIWGANAVNGVINIITKSAKETQGTLVTGGMGTLERAFGAARYGDKIGENAYYRIYAKFFDREDFSLRSGSRAGDSSSSLQGGFRTDWEVSDDNLYTFQGDAYYGVMDQTFTVPTGAPPFSRTISSGHIRAVGANLLGRWTHTFSDTSDLQVQSYFDHTVRDTFIVKETRDTADLEVRHRFSLGELQDIVWGLGYRRTWDDLQNSPAATPNIAFDPVERTDDLFSAFIQDEFRILPDRLSLILGSKFEHNDYTGFEIQPSIRLSWSPVEAHIIWAAVSRAVRTPSRAEEDITINNPGIPPGLAPLRGSRSMDSEELLAYELGYRVRPRVDLSFDIAAFYNVYDRLRSIEAPPAFPGAFRADNNLEAETYGVEVGANYDVRTWWRLRGAYTWMEMQIHRKNGSTDAASERTDEGKTPHHQVYLRSSFDLPRNFDFDATIRYVDQLSSLNVPSYVALDLRLAWRPIQELELAIVAQNLLDDRHPEFAPSFVNTPSAEVEHSVYGKITWRF